MDLRTDIPCLESLADLQMQELQDKKACLETYSILQIKVIEKQAEEYTTVTGSYTAWRTDVNLASPDPTNPFTADDEHIDDYYNSLQYSLHEHNLPETVDRTSRPRKTTPSTAVSIVLLSSPVECLGILLEGGRQCPGDMLLVMSPTWLIKDKSEDKEGLHSLYVKKAITFDRCGCSYIDVFEIPRRCTYFVNFFTRACTDGQRNDGENVELDLDCPMSSSIELCKRVDDKLLTRIWMAAAGVFYPETLAFAYKPSYEYAVPNDVNIRVCSVENKDEVKDYISKELQIFLNSEGIQLAGKVVVKPSGPIWHASRGVTFHEVTEFDQIYNAVIDLLDILEIESTVLVEAFHRPPAHRDLILDESSYRIRVCVCRQADNTPITSQIVCGIGKKNTPINGDNTIPLTFDTTMKMWGINEKERQRLYNTVKLGSEKILGTIMEDEKNLSCDSRGGPGAQTDIIGIDYVLSEIKGSIEPVGIEVNSHDCTIICQFFETLNPHRQGETTRPLIQNMIKRSQMFAMKDKTVLVVGAGGFSKRFIWDGFKDYGIKIVLVDPDESSYAASKASSFIKYDFIDHTQDQQHAENIIQILKEQRKDISGSITFWEDCGPLSATIAKKLNLRGPGEEAASIAKKKSFTQRLLNSKTDNHPHFPRTYLYSGKVAPIFTEWDIDNAIEHVGLPAVLKLEYGSSAVGVKPVSSRIECVNVYNQIKTNLCTEEDHPGVGLGHGNDLFLMEKLSGTEHDIDVVIYNRQLVAAFVSDNGPTKKGGYTETTASMPTCLPLDRQGQIITAAYQCCTEIGLVDGVFNVEMMMTTYGPKLIEINARMGGFYLCDWIRACYGVDILLAAFMISLGIRPIIQKPVSKCHLMGTMCVPSLHRKQLEDCNIIKLLENLIQTGMVRYNQIEASLDDCGNVGMEEPFCNIAVKASESNQAKQNLIAVCTVLGLHSDQYDLNYYLKDF